MRKALHAALAAAAILVLAAPAKPATAMPVASHAAIRMAAKTSSAVTRAHDWRHHRYWAWRGTYWYPRHYWYAPLSPRARYYVWGPYWGHHCYNGRYRGWGRNDSCYM
ncbi:MAG TPA: hypothetical protein VMA30_22100 [Xanthobacteraceae bacterium]|nr:hypothetical protein [Xanthobacteraceae bacterium]